MFVTIATNNATHIAIHIPKEGADKSLPAIAAMLEHNATFIRNGWNEIEVVKPAMAITLGNEYETEREGQKLVIRPAGDVLPEDFVSATPEVLASHAEARKKWDAERSKLIAELQFVKNELADKKEQLRKLIEGEDGGQEE